MKQFLAVGFFIVTVIAIMLGSAFGAEVPAPASAPPPEVIAEVEKPSTLGFLIALETVWKILGMIGTVLIAWVFKLIGSKLLKDEGDKEVVNVLQAGVLATYIEFVQELKRAASDGKLTGDEVKTAREMAYNKAIAQATGPTKALLLAWGKEKAMAVIELIVNKLKKKKEKKRAEKEAEAGEA